VLNRNGVGGTELVYDAAAANIIGGLDLRDSYDGTGWYTDPLYDAANDAFLVQRVRLEALAGSAGLSTNLVMRIGRLGMLIDNSSIASPLAIDFGLGTTDVMNTDIFGTDGTTHATIAVAAGSPGAVVARAPDVQSLGRLDALDRAVLRAVRTTLNIGATLTARGESADSAPTTGKDTLRAARQRAAPHTARVDLAIASLG
jgi:hypothetical protein